VNAYVNKGVALGKLEKYEEAIACYDKAIGLDQKNASAYFNKSCVFSLMKQKKEALKNLAKAIELDESIKEDARTDEDLKSLWRLKAFKELMKE
jgi:tetratricopeptide (TPR) repeat protein